VSKIAGLYLARGDALARGQENSGRIWGGAVNQLGQMFGQVAAQYPEMQQQERERQIDAQGRALFKRPTAPTSQEILSVYGPERGAKVMAGLAALRPDPVKDFQAKHEILRDVMAGMDSLTEPQRADFYPSVRQNLISRGVIAETDAPEAYDPEWWKSTRQYGQQQAPPAKPAGTREIRVKNPDGSESVKIVPDTPGQDFTSAAPKKEPPKPGTEEHAIWKLAKDLGYATPTGDVDTSRLTEAQIDAARRRHASAVRFVEPKEDKPRDKVWVTRNGQLIPIEKGTEQPGDVPRDAVSERQQMASEQDRENKQRAARGVAQTTLEAIGELGTIGEDGTVTLKDATQGLFGLRIPGLGLIPGTERANAAASLERLKSQAIVGLMNEMKAQSRTGATGFGALNKEELVVLQTGATKLSSSAISDQSAAEELSRIARAAMKAFVPREVADALTSAPAGKHTLSDGSVWVKHANGAVTRGQ
jgi:hypothetical protein